MNTTIHIEPQEINLQERAVETLTDTSLPAAQVIGRVLKRAAFGKVARPIPGITRQRIAPAQRRKANLRARGVMGGEPFALGRLRLALLLRHCGHSCHKQGEANGAHEMGSLHASIL